MTNDRDKKRASSHWDDAARADIGREHRQHASPHGVPIIPEPSGVVSTEMDLESSFTPIPVDLLEMFDDPKWRSALHTIWEHTANMELRAAARVGNQPDFKKQRDTLLELVGTNGKDGMVGRLRTDIDGVLSRAWWFLTVLVGGFGAAVVKLIIIGRAYGELEAEVRGNRARVQLVESVLFRIPVAAPEKAAP